MSRRGKKSRSWSSAHQRQFDVLHAEQWPSNGKTMGLSFGKAMGLSLGITAAGVAAWVLSGTTTAIVVVVVALLIWGGVAIIASQRRQHLA